MHVLQPVPGHPPGLEGYLALGLYTARGAPLTPGCGCALGRLLCGPLWTAMAPHAQPDCAAHAAAGQWAGRLVACSAGSCVAPKERAQQLALPQQAPASPADRRSAYVLMVQMWHPLLGAPVQDRHVAMSMLVHPDNPYSGKHWGGAGDTCW